MKGIELTNAHRKKAKRFSYLLTNGKIRQATLPNHAVNYDIEQRMFDKERYVRFIQSCTYEELLSKMRAEYVK